MIKLYKYIGGPHNLTTSCSRHAHTIIKDFNIIKRRNLTDYDKPQKTQHQPPVYLWVERHYLYRPGHTQIVTAPEMLQVASMYNAIHSMYATVTAWTNKRSTYCLWLLVYNNWLSMHQPSHDALTTTIIY